MLMIAPDNVHFIMLWSDYVTNKFQLNRHLQWPKVPRSSRDHPPRSLNYDFFTLSFRKAYRLWWFYIWISDYV